MPSFPEKVKKFLTTDGEVTGKGIAKSIILGGLYLGLPAYLLVKNIGTIIKTTDKAMDTVGNAVSHYKKHTYGPMGMSRKDYLKGSFASVNKAKSVKAIFAGLALAGAVGVADHYTSFENENGNRLSHYGVGGTVGSALAGASADYMTHKRGWWESFWARAWHKTADISATTVEGVASTAASFADPKDKEGNVIFENDKTITVCADRTDVSDPVKNTEGKIVDWKLKTGPHAVSKSQIRDYAARMNAAADEFKKPGSAFRKALAESPSGLVIIEPGALKSGATAAFQAGVSCPDSTYKWYKYTPQIYLTGPGKNSRTPDGFTLQGK
jgi:hypothetical protein